MGRLVKDNRTLHATAETRPGMIGRAVDWDLRRSEATLVLEVAAADMDSARVTLVSERGNVTTAISVSGNPSVFRLVTLRLPPGHYTAIVLEMTPHPRIEKVVATGWTELKPGQLWLRGYDVFLDSPGPTALPPGS